MFHLMLHYNKNAIAWFLLDSYRGGRDSVTGKWANCEKEKNQQNINFQLGNGMK